jgi:surface antigen
MMWNDNAVAVGIYALGKVETQMDYGAINPVDPISIGIFQWFGMRAAALLFRIQSENPSSLNGLSSTLKADMAAHSANDAWWNTRYLTAGERSNLGSIMAANQAIQISLARTDFDGYKNVALSNGMDANNNTQSVLYFANMYNQGPVYALRVLRAATKNATLLQLHNACLADAVLGQYASRYNEAYSIINNMDNGGLRFTGTEPAPDPDGTQAPAANPVERVERQGNNLVVKTANGLITCYPVGRGIFLPRTPASTTTQPDPVEPDPDPSDPGQWTPRDDYPYKTHSWSQPDPWNFYKRECTSFCAWRVRNYTNHKSFNNHYKGVMWGNAINWDNAAAQVGIRVTDKPGMGSVAVRNRGTYGHVAFVYRVGSNGSYGVEEYNALNNHNYRYQTSVASGSFDAFIHFEDL